MAKHTLTDAYDASLTGGSRDHLDAEEISAVINGSDYALVATTGEQIESTIGSSLLSSIAAERGSNGIVFMYR